MLCQVPFNSTISRNVVKAFKELHARGLYHGDVRVENLLVRCDYSVVVVDFEGSEIAADDDLLKEIQQVKSLLASLKKGALVR